MKKLAIIFLSIGVSVTVFGQKKKVSNASYLLQSYLDGYGSNDLEKARTNIDEAVLDTVTGKQPGTWYLRAKIYAKILTDSTKKSQYDMAIEAGVSSLKKISDYTDPKFKIAEDDITINEFGINTFNLGIDNFQTKKFDASAKYFQASYEIASFLEKRKLKSNLSSKSVLENVIVAAGQSENLPVLISSQKLLISIAPNDTAYDRLIQYHLINKDKAGARAVIEEAVAKYPNSKALLIHKINTYIQDGKVTEGIDYIKKAIELDPKNDNLWFALGDAYESSAKVTEAKDAYGKAYEYNPKNLDAVYNLGVIEVKETNALLDQIKFLGISAADQKKEVELKAKRKEVALKAKAYFTKALAIDPANQASLDAMAKVDKIIAQ